MGDEAAAAGSEVSDDFRTTLVTVFIVTCNVLPIALVGALSNLIRAELGFGEARFGFMVSLFYVLSALFSLAMGSTIERWGPTLSMRVSAASGALGLLVIVLIGNSWTVVAAGLSVTAFGMAVGTPAANLALARRVRAARRGLAFGVKQASAPGSSLLAGLAVTLIAVRFGWRAALMLGVLLALAGVFLIPDVDGTSRRPIDHVPGRARTNQSPVRLRSWPRTIRTAAAGFAFANAGAASLSVFVVPTIVAAGIDIATAGTLLALGSAAGIVSRVLVGWRADSRSGGHFKVVALMITAGATGFGLLAVGVNASVLAFGTVLGFAAGWGWNGLFALAIVEENPSAPALATGRVQVGGLAGSAVGPLVFGWLAQFSGYRAAWSMTLMIAVVGALLMALTHRLVVRQAAEETLGTSGDVDGAT